PSLSVALSVTENFPGLLKAWLTVGDVVVAAAPSPNPQAQLATVPSGSLEAEPSSTNGTPGRALPLLVKLATGDWSGTTATWPSASPNSIEGPIACSVVVSMIVSSDGSNSSTTRRLPSGLRARNSILPGTGIGPATTFLVATSTTLTVPGF